MPLNKLTQLLDSRHVRYLTIQHSPAYTAQEIAEAAHIPGREVAKTVIVKVDGQLAMAVTRAPAMVNTEALRKALGAKEVVLATEAEFDQRFPDCEEGAMPPFGELYGMDLFVSSQLARDARFWFNAGNHKELIQIAYTDFDAIAKPVVLEF